MPPCSYQGVQKHFLIPLCWNFVHAGFGKSCRPVLQTHAARTDDCSQPLNKPFFNILCFLSHQSHRKLDLFTASLQGYTFPVYFIILMKYRSPTSPVVLSEEGGVP